MRKYWTVFVLIGVMAVVLLSGCQTGEAAIDEPVVQEKPVSAYFMDSCSGCHGATRQGATGPALLPQRLDQPDE